MLLLALGDICSKFFAGFLQFLVLFEGLNLDAPVVFQLARKQLVGSFRELQERVIGYFHFDCLDLPLRCLCGLVEHPIPGLLIPFEESLIFEQSQLHPVSPSVFAELEAVLDAAEQFAVGVVDDLACHFISIYISVVYPES